jgi:N-hydroxyarylamine O-acetyltransferase
MNDKLRAYLDRIRYEGEITPTAETLRGLHRAHMLAVPFENLDIRRGVPITLSVPAFYEKVVARRRGGFCYELNGLFAWLLSELGFSVTLLSASVFSSGILSPEFDHLALWVACEGPWVADVGFGDSSLVPLRAGHAAGSESEEYSVAEAGESWIVQRRREPQYALGLTPRRLEEFEDRCVFQQTSPDSHFTRNTICSLATETGRKTLSGAKLILTTGERREEREVGGAEEYRGLLASMFGIELGEREVDRLIQR